LHVSNKKINETSIPNSREKKIKSGRAQNKCAVLLQCTVLVVRIARRTSRRRKGSVVARDADTQHLLRAHQNSVLRPARLAVETQVIGFLEIQRGRRARDAPAPMARALDDAMEVSGEEEGDLGVRLVHLNPQHVVCIDTTNHGALVPTMAPNPQLGGCVPYRVTGKKHLVVLENTAGWSQNRRRPLIGPAKDRHTIERFGRDSGAELAIARTVRYTRYTRLGTAKNGASKRDLEKVEV